MNNYEKLMSIKDNVNELTSLYFLSKNTQEISLSSAIICSLYDYLNSNIDEDVSLYMSKYTDV